MMNNFKPLSPIGPNSANGGSNTVTTQSTPHAPQPFSNSAQLSHLQAKVDSLEGRLVALEAVVRHQQVLIGVLQQAVYSR